MTEGTVREVIDREGLVTYRVDGGNRPDLVERLRADPAVHQVVPMGTLLHVSSRTIDSHRQRIMEKLGLHTVAELTKYAVRQGMTSLDA